VATLGSGRVEIYDGCCGDGKAGGKIEEIMVHSMEEVMGHGIPAASEYVVADCWIKS
jgi:hypothetical protein